ncbi:palmitoleoyl-protein carboxylesterase notum1a-like [Oncorhynchus masou masou]|uniref:palmitoleoyl-protein carboxylesterase notum1a-like n=1 Tax=Oncorhynchus masou masou TaxID=90313 RepID=UPI00318362B3
MLSVFYKSTDTRDNRHTSLYIADELKAVINDLGPQKVFALVTDQAAFMFAALSKVEESYPHITPIGYLKCIKKREHFCLKPIHATAYMLDPKYAGKSNLSGTGILSPLPEENPHWWNANMVFIPYCSSDVWSGASAKTDHSGYAFMGSLIIQEVVKDLLTKGLDNAKVLLLAGSRWVGDGVLLNVDPVAELLEGLGHPGIQVRGLADSGWFLDNKQYRSTDCHDTISCAPTEAIKRGIKYWGSVVPERCRQVHLGEEWNCFFGYRVFPSIKSPVFVVQWLFDEAQLTVDNIHLTGQPVQEGQWRYIQNLGIELRNTLKDVPAMFAPACLSHEVITRNYWIDVQVKGTSLPRALHCWDRSLQDNSRNNKAPPKGCPVHLIDSCPWPHCNPTCPTIRDQFTGQEMNVIQFLMHMGFDVQKMAQQQGMDPSKLLGMLSSGS